MKNYDKMRNICSSNMYRLLILYVLLHFSPNLFFNSVYAQANKSVLTQLKPDPEKVRVLRADSLVIVNHPEFSSRRLNRNVILSHKGLIMYCESAIQNINSNIIEAYGGVRIVQGDTISIRGDTMFYYGDTRQAILRGHVMMRDRKMTLTTSQLSYDMGSGIAHYPVPGRIIDKENVLTSFEGFYDTRAKQFDFRRDVHLTNSKGTLIADSLLYNSLSRVATFRGLTHITNKDGVLTAIAGNYNTTTGISNFQRRATVETPKYRLTGDSLYYDNISELGIARGNVIMIAKDNKTVILGDQARYNGKIGISRVTGHPIAKSIVNETTKDTLFIRADTLFSFDNKNTNRRRLLGQKNVYVYKSDLQSKCDSLIYDIADSTIYFYKKPVVWSQDKYQMEADSMRAILKNNRIHTLYLKAKSFVVSLDVMNNYNQVKGRAITAFFATKTIKIDSNLSLTAGVTSKTQKSNARTQNLTQPASHITQQEQTVLERVLVEGNGQSIYYALDDKNKLVGLNHVECSRMNIEFRDNKVGQIRFYGHPDSQLVPPKEFNNENQQLDGFHWRESERPTKNITLWRTEFQTPVRPTNKNSIYSSHSNSVLSRP